MLPNGAVDGQGSPLRAKPGYQIMNAAALPGSRLGASPFGATSPQKVKGKARSPQEPSLPLPTKSLKATTLQPRGQVFFYLFSFRLSAHTMFGAMGAVMAKAWYLCLILLVKS